MERKYVLSVLVQNNAGVLSRVSGLFSRRSYNISSLTVGETMDRTVSRMTIQIYGNEDDLEQVKKQLSKLEEVIKIADLKEDGSVLRELMLVKVSANDSNRSALIEICNVFRSRIIDLSPETATIEV
jgi:acetolactate synthase-1/3 small subunit